MEQSEVSEAEADEMLQGIINLKKLAIAIGEEQCHQDDTIDKLSASVDKSNVHMSQQIRKINKLM